MMRRRRSRRRRRRKRRRFFLLELTWHSLPQLAFSPQCEEGGHTKKVQLMPAPALQSPLPEGVALPRKKGASRLAERDGHLIRVPASAQEREAIRRGGVGRGPVAGPHQFASPLARENTAPIAEDIRARSVQFVTEGLAPKGRRNQVLRLPPWDDPTTIHPHLTRAGPASQGPLGFGRRGVFAADPTPPGATAERELMWPVPCGWARTTRFWKAGACGGPPSGISEVPRPSRDPRHQTEQRLHLPRSGGPNIALPLGDRLQISSCFGLGIGQLVSLKIEIRLPRVVGGATGVGPDFGERKIPVPREPIVNQKPNPGPEVCVGTLGGAAPFLAPSQTSDDRAIVDPDSERRR